MLHVLSGTSLRQRAVCPSHGAFTAVLLGLAQWLVLTGVGAGTVGPTARAVAAGLSSVMPSWGPVALSAAMPSWGLVALPAVGAHLAPRFSQWLDQVGLETETRAMVNSEAGLAAVGTLAEARAAVGDGIEPLRKCPRPGSAEAGWESAGCCIIETLPPAPVELTSLGNAAPGARAEVSQSSEQGLSQGHLPLGSLGKCKYLHITSPDTVPKTPSAYQRD